MNEKELKAFKTRIAKDYPAYWELADYVLILEQERNNYKELYEKEKEKWEALKTIFIGKFNSTQDTIYLDILTDIMQEIERL